ncbi:M48 family metallopeptidase [Verrucomicrobiales bacterium BCK34]|nr:M48 family metallopeptidase [Verrucomicrobiales bacterium BCK34]
MLQYNGWFFVIVLALFLSWKLDLISTLLNLKALSPEIPEAFREVVDEEAYEKSQEYTRAKSVFGVVESIFSLVVLFVFWWFGGFGWLDELARGLGRGPVVTGLVFIGLLLMGQQALSTPFELYNIFVLEEQFGFNRMTLGTWLGDHIKGAVLGVLIGAPLLALLLWLFQSVPLAWLWAWVAVTAFSLLLTYVAPTWIMPLFNKFEPLPEGELKTEIHAMSEKCDFPLKEVSVMDGSKRSAKSNAFFTGIGNNKRIALFDTLIENHTTDELVGVLAHEIGHFKKKHIVKSLLIGIVTTGVMFFLLGLMLNNRGLFDAFGVKETSVYVSLVLFGLLLSPLNEILSVSGNWLSRKNEFEADAYAAEVTGKPEAMVSALKKLSTDNLSNLTPHPFYVWLNYTHPPVVERVAALEGAKAP